MDLICLLSQREILQAWKIRELHVRLIRRYLWPWLDWINEDLTDLPRDMNESSALDSHFTIVANISLFSMVTYILPKYRICIKVLLFFATCYVLQIDSRFCLLFLPRVFLLNVEFKAAEQNLVPRFSQIDVTKEKEKEKHYEQISSWNFRLFVDGSIYSMM